MLMQILEDGGPWMYRPERDIATLRKLYDTPEQVLKSLVVSEIGEEDRELTAEEMEYCRTELEALW
jgi:hypothetical protein